MRSFVFTCSLLLGVLAGACSFDPNIPSGSLLCNDHPQCPRGYTCEMVVLAADRRVKACCTKSGCTDLSPQDQNRIIGGALDKSNDAGVDGPVGGSCGNSKVEQGETCDPPGSCPAACPPSGCMRRKLEGSASSCTARCVDDTPQTACMTGDGCCPSGCAGMDDDCNCTCGNGMVEASCGEKCDPVGSCPSTCPNEVCKKRKLVNPGSCQAECIDDGVETECVSGDGCCPGTCDANNDTDCRASCGNMVLETGETCDPGDTCPTACPAIGCTLQKLEGASRTCDAKCVDAGKQTACASGDACCPMGCTSANDKDCECMCGNGTVEPVCGETCDPLSSCPTACPAMGCQLRRLVNGGSCQAQCVADGTQTRCMSGDDCCPSACNATNDNDCTPRCGNGAVETGETCDPPASCPRSCPWNGCGRRKLEGTGNTCTARCVDDGTQTECASGDGCCPPSCSTANDNDCTARCGNGVREGSEKCDGADCPTSCPAMGCQRRRLQGSASQCTAECVNDTVISMCASGDACCPPACNRNNDAECACSCGNGTVEPACGEKCEGSACPTSCPPQGCMLRKLQGTGCMAECVPDGMRTTCTNGDGCCPGGCTANNDNDCTPRCGNGAVETGETCDPTSTCQMQFDACVDDRNFKRVRQGTVGNCTFRCMQTARTCSGTTDGACPTSPACTPCGTTCGPGQDVDCKLTNGMPCTTNSQCMTACVDGRCCESTCTGQCRSCAINGMFGLCRNITSGVDTNSTPACSGNNTCSASGTCLLGPGQPCTANTQCAAGVCNFFWRDADGDGRGTSPNVRVCGTAPPPGYAVPSNDCCDSDSRAFPGQTMLFTTPRITCGGFDFDCDTIDAVGSTTVQKCDTVDCSSGWCAARPNGTPGCDTSPPSCGVTATWLVCHRTGPGGGFCDQINEQRTQACR